MFQMMLVSQKDENFELKYFDQHIHTTHAYICSIASFYPISWKCDHQKMTEFLMKHFFFQIGNRMFLTKTKCMNADFKRYSN